MVNKEITDDTKEYKLRAFFNKPTVHNLLFHSRPTGTTVKDFENKLIDELITWEWKSPNVSYKMIQTAIIRVTTSSSGKVNISSQEIKLFVRENYGVTSTWDSDKEYELNKSRQHNSHNKSYTGKNNI